MSEDEPGPEAIPKWWAASDPPTGEWRERRRLASAMRRVIHRLVEVAPTEAFLAAAADELEQRADALDALASVPRHAGVAEASTGAVGVFRDLSPVLGHSNPLAPPVDVRVDGHRVLGSLRFLAGYEGPPGHAHGGLIAAAFDEVLGVAQSLSGRPGFTGTLRVRYRSPTPLGADLRIEASLDRVEGRKILTSGRLLHGATLCAEAEGLFISMSPGHFDEMRRRIHGGATDGTG